MNKVDQLSKRFFRDERGATAIEYGLIAGGIFLGIVTPVASMKTNLSSTYQDILDFFTRVGV